MTVSVRELPPLRLSVSIETPSGKCYRWGSDEPRPEDVYSGLSFSTIMPGGYEAMDARLPRKAALDYSDLERLSTISIYGAGGELAGEYRLEKSPRESGTDRNISPQAVGWQAALDDDATATYLGVDRDLSHWGDISNRRGTVLMATHDEVTSGSVAPDETGIPALELKLTPAAGATGEATSVYDAGPSTTISSIYYDYTSTDTVAGMEGYVGVVSDDAFTATQETADLITGDNSAGTGTFTPTVSYRYGYVAFHVHGAHAGGGDDHLMSQRRLAVWGPGVTKRGTAPDDGLYASDIIAAVVGEFAPVLNFSTGSNGTIQPSGFILPQAEWRSPTTAATIIRDANRFHIRDWAVWDSRTFYYHDRGARGRTWRSRVGEAKLSETGPQVDKLFNGVLVSYNDVDGTQKTVGPTGSGANTESATLLDSDPENPVNRLGIRRWATLDMGIVSTSAGATEVGWRFLQESKAYDTSGQATLQGHVTSDRGVVYPAFMVQAGDQITFTDAADPRPRRIVKTSYDHDSRTCSIDLDAPPEGMDALLERLGVVLVPIGL